MYGKELIVDLKGCDISRFNRKDIEVYFIQLCDLIDMQREALHFWDDEGVPEEERRTEDHVVGITAVQFIITSSITIHTLSKLGEAYVNIFSCKDYDSNKALGFTRRYFGAKEFSGTVLRRG